MPVEMMQNLQTLQTLLSWAFGVGAFLLTVLVGLVAYVFTSLKKDVEKVATGVTELHIGRVKLMHREDCRATVDYLNRRLDEQDAVAHEISERLSFVEGMVGVES